MSPDRLISQSHDKAVPGLAEHIRKFWDPRMRNAISRTWTIAAQGWTRMSAMRSSH
jgi:hypothetical protein